MQLSQSLIKLFSKEKWKSLARKRRILFQQKCVSLFKLQHKTRRWFYIGNCSVAFIYSYGIKEYNYNNVVFIFLYAISFVLRIPQTLCCNNMMSEHFPNYKMKNVLILMKQNMWPKYLYTKVDKPRAKLARSLIFIQDTVNVNTNRNDLV